MKKLVSTGMNFPRLNVSPDVVKVRVFIGLFNFTTFMKEVYYV